MPRKISTVLEVFEDYFEVLLLEFYSIHQLQQLPWRFMRSVNHGGHIFSRNNFFGAGWFVVFM